VFITVIFYFILKFLYAVVWLIPVFFLLRQLYNTTEDAAVIQLAKNVAPICVRKQRLRCVFAHEGYNNDLAVAILVCASYQQHLPLCLLFSLKLILIANISSFYLFAFIKNKKRLPRITGSTVYRSLRRRANLPAGIKFHQDQ